MCKGREKLKPMTSLRHSQPRDLGTNKANEYEYKYENMVFAEDNITTLVTSSLLNLQPMAIFI